MLTTRCYFYSSFMLTDKVFALFITIYIVRLINDFYHIGYVATCCNATGDLFLLHARYG